MLKADHPVCPHDLEQKKDLFLAKYTGMRAKDSGTAFSYCVWSENVVSLLPRTDCVVFFRPEGDSGHVVCSASWDQAIEVLGAQMMPQELYPERYLVSGFPTEEQLRLLRS